MNRIISWLRMTDWNMDTPAPYSLFHISVSVAGIAAALWLAWRLTRPAPDRTSDVSQRISRVLFLCGLFLAAGELYKQLFLYYVILVVLPVPALQHPHVPLPAAAPPPQT